MKKQYYPLRRSPVISRQLAWLLLIQLGLVLSVGSSALLYAQNGPACSSYTTKTTANGLGAGSTAGIYAVAGPTSTTIYAAQYNSPSGGGVSISTNGGASFTNYNSGMAETTVENVMAVGSRVYAATNGGLAVSTNGGISYTNKTTANGLGSNTTIGLYAVGNTVYVGTTSGLSISTDGGNTFVNKTTANGLGGNSIRTIFAVGSTVYAGTNNGLSISTDGGNTFVNKTTANGLGAAIMLGVYVDGSTIYAGTDGGGLSISTNGGTSFTTKTTSSGLGSNGVRRVFAIGSTVYAATEGGLSISTNGGSNFTNYTTSNGLGANYTTGLFVLNNVVYAGNSNGGVSFCSAPCTTTVSIAATPSLTVASGQSTTLTASGASTYVWSTGATTASINPTTSGTYSVTGTGTYNCTATASTTLIVTPVTLTTAATASSICVGGTSTLSVTPSGGVAPYTYSWAAPAGVTLSATNTSSVTATGTTSGVKTFTVVVTGTNTTPVSTTLSVTVNGLPTPSIAGTLTVCAGQSTQLTVSGGTSYVWNTGSTTSGISASAGTYSVTATLGNCSAGATAMVTETPLPTVSITATPSLTIASGQSTTLTASGASSYVWTTGATSAAISVSPTTATAYSVTATTSGCSATATATVSVTTVQATGAALNFDGVDDYVNLGMGIPTVTTFTLEAWVNPAAGYGYFGPSGDPVEVISRWGAGGAGYAAYRLSINPSGNIVGNVYNASNASSVTSNAAIAANTWTHIAFTRSADNTLRVYINGVLNGTVANSAIPQASNYPVYLGKPIQGENRYKGSMDEVRIWNRALAACELLNNRNCELGSGQTGLLAYYKFNQNIANGINAGATSLTDASGNANTGTLNNFSLNGNSSNWTGPGGVTTGVSCAALPTPSVAIAVTSGSQTICAGTSVTFTATPTNGGTTPAYQWKKNGVNVGSNSTTYTDASLTNGMVITCVLTSDATCPSTTTVTSTGLTMTVNDLPTVNIAGTLTVCVGQSTQLTASGGTNYLWNTGATTPDITASAGSYTVTATTNGCSASATTTVTTVSLPTVSIAANPSLTISSGASTQLTASGATSYSWNTGATASTISASTVGTYSVTGTTGTCSATASAAVAVTSVSCASPTVYAVTGGGTLCSGATGVAIGLANSQTDVTYQLKLGNTNLGSPVTGTGSALSFGLQTEPGTYIVEATNSMDNCAATMSGNATLVITPSVTPSVSITSTVGTQPICGGTSVTFTAKPTNDGTSPAYQWKKNGVTVGSNSTTYTDAGLINGDVISCVLTSNATCATSTSAISNELTITVNTPAASIAGTLTVCAGQSTQLTASGGTSYLWNTGATTASITAPAGTYSVLATLGNCSVTATAIITATALPVVNITANPSLTVVSGQSTTLTASGADSYRWSTGANTASLPVIAGTYSVTGTSGGCSSVVSAIVSLSQSVSCVAYVPRNLVVSVAKGGNSSDYNGSYVPDGTVNGAPAWLGPVGGKFQVRIRWNASSGRWELVNGSTVHSTAPGTGNNLPCTGWTTTGNVVSAQTLIPTITQGCGVLSNIPVPTLAGQLTVCGTQPTTLTASGGETYLWSTGETTSSISVSEGTYTVTAMNAAGCSSQATKTVTSVALPTATIVSNATVCAGQSTTMIASGGDSYVWNTGATTPTISVPAGSYTVTVTTNGCPISASATITTTSIALPVVSIASPSLTLSVGGTAVLTASGADSYVWNTGETMPGISTGQIGTYSVRGTSQGCESLSASVTVSLQQGATCVAYEPRNLVVSVAKGGNSSDYNGSYVPNGTFNGAPAWLGPVGGKFQVRIRWNASSSRWELVNGSTVHSTAPGTGNNLPCIGWTTTGNVVSTQTLIPTITQGCGVLSNIPVPTLAGQLTVCGTQPTTLTASGGETYLWSTGETTSSISVSEGTYTVTAMNAAGCSSQATKTVTSVALPTATIVSNATVCAGQSTTMIASGGDSYVWNTGATTPTISVPAGSYTVTVTTNGCPISASAAITTTSIALPVVSIASPSLILSVGGTTVLTASGADSYVWNTGETMPGISTGQIGTYSVRGTSQGCESLPASVTVSLQQGASCVAYEPRNLVVSVAEGGSYSGIYSGSYVPNGTFNGAPAWLGPVGGKFQVRIRWNASSGRWELVDGSTVHSTAPGTGNNLPCTGWTASGNLASSKTRVPTITQGCGVLSNIPVPTLAGQLTVCGTQPTTLTASGGETYLWSTGETTSSISVSEGTYTVTAMNAAGCSSQATKTVTSVALPTAAIVSNATVCAGQSTQLTASGGSSYRWSTGATTPTVSGPAGSYTVTVTNANGCSTSATTTVTATTLAAPGLTTATRSLTTSATLVSLTDFTSADNGNILQFTTSGGTLINPPVASIAQAGIQNFLVSQTNASGCVSPTTPLSLTIIEAPRIVAASAARTQVCVSSSTSLSVDVSSLGSATKTYLWEGSAGVSYTGNTTASPTVTFSTAGVKSFTVTVNAAGVKYTGTVSVTTIALPDAPSLTSASRSLTVSNTSVTLSDFATGTGILRFFNTSSIQTTASLATAGVQSFSVSQTSAEGCVSPSTLFSLTVVQPVVYPPASQTVCKGANLSLTMPVVSGNPIYDWYVGGTSVLNFIKVPAPTNILKLTNVQKTANYYCKVSVGSVTTTYGPYQVVVNPNCTARMAAATEPTTELSVLVAPNPLVGGRLQATVRGASGTSLTVSIYNPQGHLIHQLTWKNPEPEQPIDLDMSQQPVGLYLLRAETDTQQKTIKLIHQ